MKKALKSEEKAFLRQRGYGEVKIRPKRFKQPLVSYGSGEVGCWGNQGGSVGSGSEGYGMRKRMPESSFGKGMCEIMGPNENGCFFSKGSFHRVWGCRCLLAIKNHGDFLIRYGFQESAILFTLDQEAPLFFQKSVVVRMIRFQRSEKVRGQILLGPWMWGLKEREKLMRKTKKEKRRI